MVDCCLDFGINHFDTANVYHDGAAETILGRVIRRRRADVVLATKVRMPLREPAEPGGLSAPAVRAALHASLRRLGTDYVDLYYLHQPDWAVPIEETLEVLAELVDEGKIRYAGFSNYAAWQVAQAHCYAEAAKLPRIHVSQVMYNLIARHLDDEYADFSSEYAMANVAYNPLAGGLLTGKHRPDDTPPDASRFTLPAYRERYWNDRQFAAVDSLAEVARAHGLSLIELSYRWLLSRQVVDVVLVGASSLQQLELNLAAAEGPPLDASALQECDEVWQRLRGPVPKYNR